MLTCVIILIFQMGAEAGQEEPSATIPREPQLHQPGQICQRRIGTPGKVRRGRDRGRRGRWRAEDHLQQEVPIHEVEGEAQQAGRRGAQRRRGRPRRDQRGTEVSFPYFVTLLI